MRSANSARFSGESAMYVAISHFRLKATPPNSTNATTGASRTPHSHASIAA